MIINDYLGFFFFLDLGLACSAVFLYPEDQRSVEEHLKNNTKKFEPYHPIKHFH